MGMGVFRVTHATVKWPERQTPMFKKATKEQAKARLAIMGPSGSGKTYTALLVARELAGKHGKIAVIDTERGSASKYADLFQFDVEEMVEHSPDTYIKAIGEAEKAGYDVLVIDSLSHEWAGNKGALELHDRATARSKSKNSFTAWMEITPKHNRFIDAILAFNGHVIGTLRTKTAYVLEDEGGKQKPKKVGTNPIQRDGVEYEFDIVAEMDLDNTLAVTKTRCPDLHGVVIEKPGAAFGKTILDWCSTGEVPMVKRLTDELDALVGDVLKVPKEELEAGAGAEQLVEWLALNRADVLVLTGKDKRSMWDSIQGAAEVCGTTGEAVMKLAEGGE